MLTKRSSSALAAALALLVSACASSTTAGRTADVRVYAEPARTARAQTLALAEPEYVEAETPPAAPLAVAEERPAAPSSAHVWVAGHHTRRDGEWVWVNGRHELPPQAGLVWVPGHWVAHMNGYVWIDGGWR